MKKIAMMFAALSICACSVVACDSDDDAKKANGEACEAAADCTSNFCGADKKCADKPATDSSKKDNGAECAKADDCKSGFCGDDKKCADKPAADPSKKDNGAECAKADDCKSGICRDKVCGGCLGDADCKDPAKPVCGEAHECVAKVEVDTCKDCAGTCVLSICVSDGMKGVKDGDAYPADAPKDGYCVDNKLVYEASGKVAISDCKADGYGDCVVFATPNAESGLSADCNIGDAAVKACELKSAADIADMWRIDTCIPDNKIDEVWCIKDVNDKLVAVSTYDKTQTNCAKESKTCKIDESGDAACK